MKGFAVFLFLFLFALGLSAQKQEELSVNNLEVLIQENAPLFHNAQTFESGLVDKETGAPLFYASQFWFGGRTQGTFDIRVAYEYNDNQFEAGQILDRDTGTTQLSENLVKVTREEIDNHIANYQELGYETPSGILNWPVMSTTVRGYTVPMAPYVDVNEDGSYDPEDGDYPDVIGDACIYTIYNDINSGPNALGAELHVMVYAFNGEQDDFLANTVFVNLSFRNRSFQTLEDFKLGFWADFDLGAAIDDFVGTAVEDRVLYGYNSSNTDTQFGENPPSVGVKPICLPLSRSHIYYSPASSGTSPVIHDPTTANGALNYLTGFWRDGSPVSEGGNGHYSTTSEDPTAFMYPGNPLEQTGWYPAGEGLAAGDMRGLLTVPFSDFTDIYPGSRGEFAFAISKSSNTGGNHLENIQGAIDNANQAEQYLVDNYADHPMLTGALRCDEVGVGIAESSMAHNLKLYPIPAADHLVIEADSEIDAITLIDITGKAVVTKDIQQVRYSMDVSNLPQGLYLAKVLLGNGQILTYKIQLQGGR